MSFGLGETFYETAPGLRVMGKKPGCHVFFRVGEASVLLAPGVECTGMRP
jgi:hypothetical protein